MLVMIGTDCIGSCTSHYHGIKTTTASNLVVDASNKLNRLKNIRGPVINRNRLYTGSCEFLVETVASNLKFIVHSTNHS
jgi:hypothetical protein